MSLTNQTADSPKHKVHRKPDWLRISRKSSPEQSEVEGLLKELGLNTVCKEANCPNYSDCFSRKTATFMIMGTACTRNCRFCNVRTDVPKPLDVGEPENVARAVRQLGLQYVVITSVTRDDLADGGAAHFATTIGAIRETSPETVIEVLVPDFKGDEDALRIITDARPDVVSHNMETVKDLYSQVRIGADYQRSLQLLSNIKKFAPEIRAKSGIMLGLGETEEQVFELFDNLLAANCESLTIGQYLAPSLEHHPVQDFVKPEIFEDYGQVARDKGFAFVASAPLVRSSYMAEQAISPTL